MDKHMDMHMDMHMDIHMYIYMDIHTMDIRSVCPVSGMLFTGIDNCNVPGFRDVVATRRDATCTTPNGYFSNFQTVFQ